MLLYTQNISAEFDTNIERRTY